ncbi:hypothetical protein [Rhodanobacter sp. 115]|uniref:hypothetical protein n=1 Tax=Rhodanobacter sp. FW021-MT20 TaxID=1162282 RepID=UPI0012FB395A|nr:hypothetical protein [Rhodanobacter sp. 115]
MHGVVAGRETSGSADATTGEPISNRDGEVAFGADADSVPAHAINTAAITGRQFCVLSRLVIVRACPGSHPVIITGEKPPYRFGLPSSDPRPGGRHQPPLRKFHASAPKTAREAASTTSCRHLMAKP